MRDGDLDASGKENKGLILSRFDHRIAAMITLHLGKVLSGNPHPARRLPAAKWPTV
jgi:hypothetical protein